MSTEYKVQRNVLVQPLKAWNHVMPIMFFNSELETLNPVLAG
jgi:hypothetical protein